MLLRVFCLLGIVAFTQAIAVPGKAFDRFITIWLENEDFDKAFSDAHIGALKRKGITLTRYYAPTHPSQPNYVAAVGGDYFGLNHNGHVRIPENISTVVDLLDVKGISWRGYFEDLPGPGYMGEASDGTSGPGKWDYVRKHNPFISYDSVNKDGAKLWNIQDFMAFERDFAHRQVPQFVWMTPNMMNDGHNTTISFSASWSHNFVNRLIDDEAFEEKTLIMLTFDESADATKPNHIATILLGSAVPKEKEGTLDDTFYTHYSMLSSIEYNWDLPHLGRYDVGSNVFDFMLDSTSSWKNKSPANADSVDNSVSYPGPLNNEPGKFVPYPPPNKLLIGVTGQPVLDRVRRTVVTMDDAETPYDGSGNVFDGNRNLPAYKEPAANAI